MEKALLQFFLALTLLAAGKDGPLATNVKASGEPPVPYSLGNLTYISKPVYPAKIDASQIPIGKDWTYVYALSNYSYYHVYFYGDWIGSKTDYDIYVYNPKGELEALHTEAAGLPEHLGTTVTDPFFKPKNSGNYSFVIVNDLRESLGADAGTLMLIEHIDCNRWYYRYMQGKVNYTYAYNTTWAYEFVTAGKRVEVWIGVPDTLDMYEARLYIMANPSVGVGSFLNGVPLAWEPGLYSLRNSSSLYGGYNFDNDGFKHPNATASCEYLGQDMLINYTFPSKGDTFLYHLVLIGENGEGNLTFRVRTDFKAPSISIQNPIQMTTSQNETTVTAYVCDDESGLDRVLLNYTIDDWKTMTSVKMSPSQNQTYAATVPPQPPGNAVKYKIIASDIIGNTAEEKGSYAVKDPTDMTFLLSKTTLYFGESITVTGSVSHGSVPVTINYTCQGVNVSRSVTASTDGVFTDEYTPEGIGGWTVSANFLGDEKYYGVFGYKNFSVQKIPTLIDCTASKEVIDLGEKITLGGTVNPALEGKAVELEFTMPNSSINRRYAYTSPDGSFKFDLTPSLPGSWGFRANLAGDSIHLPSSSEPRSFTVNNTWMNMILLFLNQYMMYIIIAAGAATSISGVLVYLRRRGTI